MKITVAIDSMKGSMTSLEGGHAIEDGIKRIYPEAEVYVRPLADGGEGTVEALTIGMGGELRTVEVTGPLGAPVMCSYGIIRETKMAVVEMSGAAGITQVPSDKLNPMNTTSYGVGEVICDAIKAGCRRFIIGIGGSATNDGGLGMLMALGFRFLDADGNSVERYGRGLEHIAEIRTENVIPELTACSFKIACDVKNPLCGENGCSVVFGPQKGAEPEIIELMDRWLLRYAETAKKIFPEADRTYPGTGAAGGMGFAFKTFTNAVLQPGIDMVLEETRLEDYIRKSDLVVTGEGRLDDQTVMGKAPFGVACIAKKYGLPVLAFAGCLTDGAHACNDYGIDAYFPILRSVVKLEEALDVENARKNTANSVEQVFRLIRAMHD